MNFDFSKLFRRRTREEELLNIGVEVVVGGLGSKPAKRVLIRQPSIFRFRRHVGMILSGMKEMFKGKTGQEFLANLQAVLSSSSAENASAHGSMVLDNLEHAEPIARAIGELIGDLVGENSDYVYHEMGPEQVALVLKTYGDVVGYDRLKQVFRQALREKNGSGDTVGQSQKSPA